jgi:hypothetical protein
LYTVAITKNDSVYCIKVADIKPYEGRKDVVINPDLRTLKGVHFHDLKIVDGKLCFKLPSEKKALEVGKPFEYKGLSFKKEIPKKSYTPYFIGIGIALNLIVLLLIKKGLL